jgi:hypothetical protein
MDRIKSLDEEDAELADKIELVSVRPLIFDVPGRNRTVSIWLTHCAGVEDGI